MTAFIHNLRQMQEIIGRYRASGQTIGFVPTMGALHQGHLNLVEASLKECHTTVVSIFVNPTQFGPKEDLSKYPRPLEEDQQKLKEKKVDILFLPTEKEIYPLGYDTYVVQERLVQGLCGAFRPGHFRGVLTVVLKLFNIVQPHIAYFGQKDFQQVVVIRRMIHDLNVPVQTRMIPTMREPDGLAMSSRNVYLSPSERQQALCLFQGLQMAKKHFEAGETSAEKLIAEVTSLIQSVENSQLEYVSIVRPHDLTAVETVTKGHVMAIAVKIGKTRLIDNEIF